jgi:predicted amidohydrolase YtcJ
LDAIARAAEAREPGRWIAVIGGWHPHSFTEKRPPSRQDLDEAAPRNPVFVQRNYIEAFLNTRALEEMGWVGTETPSWMNRDPQSGRPNGGVVGALQSLREKLSIPAFEAQIAGTGALLRDLNRLGLTGCIDAGGFGMDPTAYHPLNELHRSGEHGFRARLLVGAGHPGDEPAQIDAWMGLVAPGSGDEFLRYLGAGEVLLFGAHDMEGLDRRDISGQIGVLSEVTGRLVAAGWPVHIHAILDESISAVLDAWEQTRRGPELAELRYTITHADQIGAENLGRIRDMGLGVTVQNGMAFRGGDSVATWGEERVKGAPPLRTMLDQGIPMAAGTDGTVVSSPNPWPCIQWMVSGDSLGEERLSRDEALRLYTSGSAWFSFEEETRGNLRAGSHADLVVLSDDPLTVPEDRIHSIKSVLTLVAGEVVHADL